MAPPRIAGLKSFRELRKSQRSADMEALDEKTKKNKKKAKVLLLESWEFMEGLEVNVYTYIYMYSCQCELRNLFWNLKIQPIQVVCRVDGHVWHV